ncbi:MAG: Unknown protein [uncultured Sulfurovum sp.]|uniref:Uncharacterized protein n=1 Tax=uncultured Sulfurovum sp. TaxID=269237 RepID=A0A6S6RWS0_9BACT|nr:MAG: Unknown protein [uncultured Sulfurovum sp.]
MASSVFLDGKNQFEEYNVKNLDGFSLSFVSNLGNNLCSNKSIKVPFFEDSRILTKTKLTSMCKKMKNERIEDSKIVHMTSLNMIKDIKIFSSLKHIMKHHDISLYDINIVTLNGKERKTIDLFIIEEGNQYFVIGVT